MTGKFQSVESAGRDAKSAAEETARWFAVKSQPKKENLALLHLKRQAFDGYLPLVRAPALASTRRPSQPSVLAPLFPGYLFVRLDLSRERWRSVNGTIGVSQIVQFGGAPSPTPRGLVEGLLARSVEGVVKFDEPLQPGENVRVVGGAFDGWIGKLRSVDSKGRAAVLLDVLARGTEILMPKSSLTRAA